ncbi:alanine racemase [Clostridium sp.]|uniref:alanine racemase n=1 Tax=Clostridium sp. TaxID=1506 RepID=UPI0026287BC6|nr:alanine racemase [Clostridium sp.]
MDLLHPMWAEINLDNFIYNINQIKKKTKNSEIIAVVKANAYGHGAIEISKTLVKCDIKKLAVANIVEGIELRDNNIDIPIMILGISEEYAIDSILKYNVEPTVSTLNFTKILNEKAKALNKVINIHLAIDSGMGRIGFRNNENSILEIFEISKLSNIHIESIYTHFSTADSKNKDYSLKQISIYKEILCNLEKIGVNFSKRNLSNSAAIIDLEEAHFDCVRPGIIQFGYYPSKDVNKQALDLKPVLSWKSRILYLKEVEANEYIGYNQNFKTTKKTKIATIPVGYADGYSRGLSNKGKVIINGTLAPILGNVCMDQIMVDVSDVKNAATGDEVILLGSDGDVKFDAEDMANILNTISYEVLCLIGRRTPRIYIRNHNEVEIKYLM